MNRIKLFRQMFDTGFVSLRVDTSGIGILVTSRNKRVRLDGFDRAEVARMARRLQGVCFLQVEARPYAELIIRKVGPQPVDLHWDRKGHVSPLSLCRNWKSF